MTDNVNHPRHYESDSGVECIEVASPLPYAVGNAVKYVWRAPYKGRYAEDLRKAQWFLNRYIEECAGSVERSPAYELVMHDLNVKRICERPGDDPLAAWREKVATVARFLHRSQDDREEFFRRLSDLDVEGMLHAVDNLIYLKSVMNQ